MKRTIGVVLGAGVLAFGVAALAAGATGLDPGYGSATGAALTPLSPSTVDRFYGIVGAPDGGTYNVGITTSPASPTDYQFALAHVDASGRLDGSFGTNGVAAVNVYPGGSSIEIARGVVVQTNGANKGKIVISGQAESAADPLDVDIYVVRFNANGTPDTSFGDSPGSAVRVLNLSPGIATTAAGTVRSADNTWGLMKQPDDKIVLEAVRGIGAAGTPNADRADRDFAAVRLNADGSRDKTFGTDGVAQIGAVFDESGQTIRAVENPRQGLIQPDGKIVLAGYTQIRGLERPLLARFNANGTPDATFGGNAGAPGIATAFPNGVNGTAEVYELGLQGTSFVTTGYGTSTPTVVPPNIDLISMRFTSNGTLDTTYGTGGIFRYDGGGQADRGRDMLVLPDGRSFMVGATETRITGGTNPTNALAVMLTKDGSLHKAFGDGGVLQVDPGGTADWFYGTTLLETGKVAVAGYKGSVPADGDDAAVARFDVGYLPPIPAATIARIKHNETLRSGPSTLTGTVSPQTGVARVLVTLTRGSGKSCRAFNLATQTFSGASCAKNKGFASVYAGGKWTAYLGTSLPSGSYVLKAVTITTTGRTQTIKPGSNQIRFTVAA